MERKSKKLERQKETAESLTNRTAKKKLERQEEQLKGVNRDMQVLKRFFMEFVYRNLFF